VLPGPFLGVGSFGVGSLGVGLAKAGAAEMREAEAGPQGRARRLVVEHRLRHLQRGKGVEGAGERGQRRPNEVCGADE